MPFRKHAVSPTDVLAGLDHVLAGSDWTHDLYGAIVDPLGTLDHHDGIGSAGQHAAGVGSSGLALRNGQIGGLSHGNLANDVEDLQVTYFFDLTGNGDRLVDPGESFANSGGTADPYGQAAATFADQTRLRELQINLVAVTRDDDPNAKFAMGAGQTTGNRASGLSAADGKRRRVHTARVRPRNAS